jgi:hypothetical protein
MGTNLSQVFVQNGAVLEDNTSTPAFNDPTSATIGIWNSVDSEWVSTALFQKTFSPLDTDENDAVPTAPATSTPVAFANPNWLYSQLQFVQGTAGNPIATPLLDVRNIRSLSFDHYEATDGHKVVLTAGNGTFTPATVGDISVRFVIRTQPTDQLSYHDGNATNYTILAGNDPLPLGGFNTTNHKVISIDIAQEDFADGAGFASALEARVDSHGLLGKMIDVAVSTNVCTLQSKHVGLIFDVAVVAENDDNILITSGAANNKVNAAVTGQVLGVGNPWQVLGEEIRCRSRYGNFNRMYLPQNMPTYTVTGNKYHKVTIEYDHNWPNSTGIAPAGALNQVVMYIGAATAIADDTTNENLAAVFGLTSTTGEVFDSVKYVW